MGVETAIDKNGIIREIDIGATKSTTQSLIDQLISEPSPSNTNMANNQIAAGAGANFEGSFLAKKNYKDNPDETFIFTLNGNADLHMVSDIQNRNWHGTYKVIQAYIYIEVAEAGKSPTKYYAILDGNTLQTFGSEIHESQIWTKK